MISSCFSLYFQSHFFLSLCLTLLTDLLTLIQNYSKLLNTILPNLFPVFSPSDSVCSWTKSQVWALLTSFWLTQIRENIYRFSVFMLLILHFFLLLANADHGVFVLLMIETLSKVRVV